MKLKKLKKGLSYYKDARGKWRWRLVGENNKIVCSSSQGFAKRVVAVSNAQLTFLGLLNAKVIPQSEVNKYV